MRVFLLSGVVGVCLTFLFFGTAFAQRNINSVDEIPLAAEESASAYYDSATGDVYLSLGGNLLFVSVSGGPFGIGLGGDFDETVVRQDSALGMTVQNNEMGISWIDIDGLASGIFNIGPLLPANRNIGDSGDFDMFYPDALIGFGPLGLSRLAIPEPSSFLIGIVLIGGMFVGRRRTN
jgi:hypothetical protein